MRECFFGRMSKKVSGAVAVILMVSFGSLGYGYITHTNETISSNTEWPVGTHYIVGYVSVSSGVKLTIPAGTVVKFASAAYITVSGTLSANGAALSKAYFTSLNDNTIGETISGSTGSPAKGDWNYIWVNSTGLLDLDHTIVLYGKWHNSSYPGSIVVNQGTLRSDQ